MPKPTKYTSSAEFYDAIYTAMKDYEQEAVEVSNAANRFCEFVPQTLLDVACGTGLHLQYFAQLFGYVEGLDLSENQLDIARQRLPQINLQQADMLSFRLDKNFDVITCLFSAIGYMRTYKELVTAIVTMAAHLQPAGVLIIEPWIFPEAWQDGLPHLEVVETDDLKLVRMNRSASHGNRSVLQMHYLVLRSTDTEPEHFVERHILTMHTKEEYLAAMQDAGLKAVFMPNDRRGYLVGIKPIID